MCVPHVFDGLSLRTGQGALGIAARTRYPKLQLEMTLSMQRLSTTRHECNTATTHRRAVVSRCSDNARARSGNERSKVHLRDSVRNGTILRNRCLSNYRQSTIRFQTKITRFAISPQVEVLRLTKVRKTCDFNRLSDSTMSPLIIAQLSGYSN